MVVARDGSPKFLKSKILRDDGCPTCGSMDYGVLEIKNSQNMIDKKQELIERITEYLASGGLFNPELMNHDAVRDLLIDLREFLSQQ